MRRKKPGESRQEWRDRCQREAEALVGSVQKCWEVVSCQLVQQSDIDPRKAWLLLVRCLNCRTELLKSKWNLLQGGAKCNACYGRPRGEAGLQALTDQYRRNAKDNDRLFSLDDEEMRRITSSDCHYCGQPPRSVMFGSGRRRATAIRIGNAGQGWGDYIYNGIDRKDNSLGYVSGNCLPCCWVCNRAKYNQSYEAFVSRKREEVARVLAGLVPCLGVQLPGKEEAKRLALDAGGQVIQARP